MITNCSECGAEMIIVTANLVNPADMVYQTVLACAMCGTKLETGRYLKIEQVKKFNPMAEKIEDKPMVQF